MQKALLVVNPSSGGEQAQEYEQLMQEKLKKMFDEVEMLHTKKAGDAKQFTRKATSEGYHSVFVMGGDGTVNEGISGISEQKYRPHFGFIPLGTVNDGKIHLVYLKDTSFLTTLKTLPDLLAGVEESTENLVYKTCEKLNFLYKIR